MNLKIRFLAVWCIIMMLAVQPIFADENVKEIKLVGIKGLAIGSVNESLQQVEHRAINEAKIKALKQAGIEENILSFTDYFQMEDKGKYEELFTTDFLSDIRGAVKDIDVVDTKKSFDEFGQLKIEVVINCTVVKYLTEKDLAFDAWIDGVGMYYQNETNLIFKIKPSKDAFVKIFLLSETEAFQLFPNKFENSYLLKANTEYKFPSETMDYTLETNKKSESHRMIIVLMKEDIPYTNDVEYKQIIDWIFSIPPHIRVIKSFGFSVVNEKKMKE
ncbi:MAG: DUF4384 domain-containing protein [Bacteroidales bacterium]